MKYRGSFTLEASFVMGITLMSIANVICFGFRLHDQTTAYVTVQEMVDTYRQHEIKKVLASDDEIKTVKNEILEGGRARTSNLLRDSSLKLELTESCGRIKGSADAAEYRGEISAERFEPEDFFRMLTLLE